jgi:type II secretory pathway component GspD/PulD (secretin)
MKKLFFSSMWLVLCYSPLASDTIRLVDAPIGAVSSYFSQLTGNTYILDFEATEKVSLQKELSGKENIHSLFVEIIKGLGGEVTQISRETFKVIKNKITPDIVEETDVTKIEVVLQRLYLEGKISKTGVQELINKIPTLSSLTIINDNSEADAILISGQNEIIIKLRKMLSNLDTPQVSEMPTSPNPKTIKDVANLKELPEEKLSILKVIDLNFADAEELVQTLTPLLASELNSSRIDVSAHQSANQVILSGPLGLLSQAEAIIAEMDRMPRQVYVDAIIAEISDDSMQKLGLQFSINAGSVSSSVVSGQTGNNIGALAGDAFLTGAVGGMVSIGAGAKKIPDIGIMIDALQGDTDNRILATPSLMTTENKESTILIGQNVPFITGQFTNQQGNGSAPFQTIKREDLGTILKLKPKIGKNGDIVMEIWQEISRIDQSAAVLSDVVTVKRQISTVVSAKEGETVAIGGLRVEQEEIGVSKVPVLGDLPVLGMLFRQESSKSVSRNLAIFLRPTLVSTEVQRAQIIETWQTELGSKLFNYENEKKILSNTPTPVGERLPIKSLRPKMRPVDRN